MSVTKRVPTASLAELTTDSDDGLLIPQETANGKNNNDIDHTAALASREPQHVQGALGDAILRFLRIRKGPKAGGHDLDSVRANIQHEKYFWQLT